MNAEDKALIEEIRERLPDYMGQGLLAIIDAQEAEVERLRRRRSEWCDRADQKLTEYMTQQRDLLAEVEALRARLTLTPERIEAAAKANYEADHPGCSWDAWDNSGWGQTLYRDSQRAALLAAGMEEATP